MNDLWALDGIGYQFLCLILILGGAFAIDKAQRVEVQVESSLSISRLVQSLSTLDVEGKSLLLGEVPLSRKLNNILHLGDHHRLELAIGNQEFGEVLENNRFQNCLLGQHQVQVELRLKQGVEILLSLALDKFQPEFQGLHDFWPIALKNTLKVLEDWDD
jgi:hypothetical protein